LLFVLGFLSQNSDPPIAQTVMIDRMPRRYGGRLSDVDDAFVFEGATLIVKVAVALFPAASMIVARAN
jgi:hypothetical protein